MERATVSQANHATYFKYLFWRQEKISQIVHSHANDLILGKFASFLHIFMHTQPQLVFLPDFRVYLNVPGDASTGLLLLELWEPELKHLQQHRPVRGGDEQLHAETTVTGFAGHCFK